MKGEQVTPRYLERHGFNYPIMVTEMEGLGLKLPPQTFSVKDVEQYVGKDWFQAAANAGFSESRTFSKKRSSGWKRLKTAPCLNSWKR